MLLVANLAKYKMLQKNLKLPKPWHMGTHLRVLGESYPMNTNMTGLRLFSKIFATKIALALKRLKDLKIGILPVS